jgi:hypothetical protein
MGPTSLFHKDGKSGGDSMRAAWRGAAAHATDSSYMGCIRSWVHSLCHPQGAPTGRAAHLSCKAGSQGEEQQAAMRDPLSGLTGCGVGFLHHGMHIVGH